MIIAEPMARGLLLASIALPTWIAFRATYRLSKPRQARATLRREILLFVVALYGVVVVAATLLPLPGSAVSGKGSISFFPGLSTYLCFTHKGDTPSEELIFCWRELVGNIALFVPLGVLLPFVSRRAASARSVLMIALAISVSIEAIQFLQRSVGMVRSVDIDDVILNLAGALLGYMVVRLLRTVAPDVHRSQLTTPERR